MEPLASRLRERAHELKLSNTEVARRAGLGQRRYANYVSGDREPDLATLLRICEALGLTPNDLLLPTEGADDDGEREALLARLMATAKTLSSPELRVAVRQIEAWIEALS